MVRAMKSNVLYYIITFLTCLVVFFIITLIFTKYELNKARADIIECEVDKENLRQSINQQNEMIDRLNKDLGLYQTKIKENNATWNKRLINAEKRLLNAKTCEDKLVYLKDTLEGLK